MINFFRELFEYGDHYNKALINLLIEYQQKVSEKSFQLLNHIINAHQVWNSRILKQSSFGIFEMHPTIELQELNAANFQNTLYILQNTEFAQAIDYSNSKGDKFSNSVRDILFQVINHSTYHRAQIATECRQNGIEPLLTDYIFYVRTEKKNQY
jgi:uncharacterized damage-inducible protein DinB